MKFKLIISSVFLLLTVLISGCQEDEKNGSYSGVSDLIADRNRARYDVAENAPEKKPRRTVSKKDAEQTKPVVKKPDLSSAILYEQKVKIVGTDSNKTLANGVAYINKKGQIVRIKIVKN